MHKVFRVLITISFGLVATGLVIGFLPSGGETGCGAAFSSGHRDSADALACAEARAGRRGLPLTLIGVGLTALVAAVIVQPTPAQGRAAGAEPPRV